MKDVLEKEVVNKFKRMFSQSVLCKWLLSSSPGIRNKMMLVSLSKSTQAATSICCCPWTSQMSMVERFCSLQRCISSMMGYLFQWCSMCGFVWKGTPHSIHWFTLISKHLPFVVYPIVRTDPDYTMYIRILKLCVCMCVYIHIYINCIHSLPFYIH